MYVPKEKKSRMVIVWIARLVLSHSVVTVGVKNVPDAVLA
jgi:hypothetical protein